MALQELRSVPDEQVCEQARMSRDPRFDGLFYTGVTSTHIYCRTVCPVPTVKRENVRYYVSAAAAEAAGFRPCLVCRPELSPGFKLPHALFALDAGVVRDEFQVIAWDGTQHAIQAWNRDQDLRSSMRNSTVWVYQDFARAIGREREREYLERLDYGNAEASGELSEFWLNGTLRISAFEQIAFLRRLHRNELPFAVEHQRLVKDLAIMAAGSDWILRAKTGWGVRVEPQVGWWVGWVERSDGAIFFALNIETKGAADLPWD